MLVLIIFLVQVSWGGGVADTCPDTWSHTDRQGEGPHKLSVSLYYEHAVYSEFLSHLIILSY